MTHRHRRGRAQGCHAALRALCLVPALLWPASAHADVVGKPQVIDAQTLVIAGRVVRLHGVAAPGLDDICGTGSHAWRCGREARSAVINRLYPHWVTCVERGHLPGQDMILAVCYLAGAGQKEVNAWLVEAGWARADPAAAPEYAEAEAAARAAGRGLWRATPAP